MSRIDVLRARAQEVGRISGRRFDLEVRMTKTIDFTIAFMIATWFL